MSASLTSGSEMREAVGRLWQARLPAAPVDRRRLLILPPVPNSTELDGSVLAAVRLHLLSQIGLEEGDLSAARTGVASALAAWSAVERAIESVSPEMASRAHAFHARLASRHQAAYGALARKELVDLAQAAKLKTESIGAAAVAAGGDERSAAEMLAEIAARWRRNVPIRLPGLRPIELTAARWFEACDRRNLAKTLHSLAQTISGRHAAYPEDSPEAWPAVLRQEDLLRFAFAASRLPAAITAETSENGKDDS
jgi:hypothetical protein